jgi:hypothetical protein
MRKVQLESIHETKTGSGCTACLGSASILPAMNISAGVFKFTRFTPGFTQATSDTLRTDIPFR